MGRHATVAGFHIQMIVRIILVFHFFPPSHLPLLELDFGVKQPMDVTPPKRPEASTFQTPGGHLRTLSTPSARPTNPLNT